MTDRPLYKELRRVFLDSWSDANGWASMLRMIAALEESDRRFQENVAGLIKAADRIIETVDQMIEED